MTTTPTATTTAENSDFAKFGRLLRKAGGAFGLDLAGLFEDEEGQPVEGFEGFAPTLRIESQLKGRSPSTLTYKAPKTPSRTAVFELAPKPPSLMGEGGGASTVNANLPQAQKEEEKKKVEEKADRLLSSFIGAGGKAGSIGAEGIGAAKQYGYTPEQILSKAKTEGLTFGEQAARSLGINTQLTGYTGAGSTPGAIGYEALSSARMAGLSDDAIQSLAKQQGLKFGEKAAQALGLSTADVYQPPAAPAPAPQAWTGSAAANYNPAGSLNQYVAPSQPGGGGGTPGAMGAAAVSRAMAAGMSAGQIAQQAAAQGLTFGPAALAMLR